MGLAGLLESQRLVERRADFALFHEVESELQFSRAAHPSSDDPPLIAKEGVEMRDDRLGPATEPEVHEGPARLQTLEVGRHRSSADRVDDDIDSIRPAPGTD